VQSGQMLQCLSGDLRGPFQKLAFGNRMGILVVHFQ
jgi:hypothetical protein